jgi:hypothetical protein
MPAILAEHHKTLPAVLELATLPVRHVRLFTANWWKGYAPRVGGGARRVPEGGARPRPRASRQREKFDQVKMDSNQKSFDRYAEPDEVAFLAGRSKFINGQVLRVDGGITLWPG